jgi:glutathione S-transferase
MKSLTIKVTVVIKAASNDIFDALTNSKQMLEWSGQKGIVQPTIGGKFEMFDGWVKGTVLGFERGKILAVTWKPEDWNKDAVSSIVTYKFVEVKDGTKVTVTHTGFPNSKEVQSHKEGWTQFVFEPLKTYLLNRQN